MFKGALKIFVFAVICFLAWTTANRGISAIERTKKSETYKELELFAGSLALVQEQYVDEVKSKDLIYGAMSGMLGPLDPHSQFMTPADYEELKVDTQGKFGGVGIEITIRDNLVTVITPIEGTPAWTAGIETNDRIVKIDDVVVKNFTLNEIVKKLRGKPGSQVTIVIWREKESKLHSYKLKRAVIDIKDIKEARIIEGNIGYLKLIEFREDTPQELDKALADLKTQGADSLILDLRNNPGGLLEKAVEVAGRFLPRGVLVVSVKGREAKDDADFKADFRSPILDAPLIILVNGGSASGSEIVAGALKDNHRAILLGAKTFGKGSVQTVFPLGDGSALKLTTSRYFTPSGKTIHETGIMPDVSVDEKEPVRPADEGQPPPRERDLEKIFENIADETANQAIDEAKDKPYLLDVQLSRAVDLLKGIKVYKSLL